MSKKPSTTHRASKKSGESGKTVRRKPGRVTPERALAWIAVLTALLRVIQLLIDMIGCW